MSKRTMPRITLSASDGISFRLPDRALSLWDKTLKAPPKTDDSAVISIMAPIYPGTADEGVFSVDMLTAALAAAEKRPLTLNINSPGGSYFEGVTIYNLLSEYPNRITVNVLGEAASAASVIAMAGDSIRVYQGSITMIHSAAGLAIGNKRDMRDLANVLDKIDTAVAEIYAHRTGNSAKKVLEMMEAETWMTPDEAVSLGFADEIVSDEKKSSKKPAAATASAPAAHGNQGYLAMLNAITRSSASHSPGASGLSLSKGITMQATTSERIQALEATRAAHVARMEMMQDESAKRGDGVFNEQERQECGDLRMQIESIDTQLEADRFILKAKTAAATPVEPGAGTDPRSAAQARQGGAPHGSGVRAFANADKGIAFARYAIATYLGGGNIELAAKIAQSNRHWRDTTPQVANFLMTAIGAGTTTGSAWADDLYYRQNLAGEFVELLRAQTIIDRIPNLRRVPFNVRMGTQTSGHTASWVGEARPIPMSKAATGDLTLDLHKVAALSAITEELARNSSPGAEAFVRDDMLRSSRELIDDSLIDPERAEVSGISPASLTYGVTPVTPSGITAAALHTDLMTLMNKYATATLTPAGGVFIMSQTTANAVMFMTNALGQASFPEFQVANGMANLRGYPVIISQTALQTGSPSGGSLIIFVIPSEVLIADDGEADVQVSREASLEMSNTPANRSDTGTGASLVSMFQTNSLALRAVRTITWKKRRTDAVQWINDANYSA